MSAIRINELARELEVKPKAITDYLPEIGITDKKSHSSALEEDVANKVREHFHSAGGDKRSRSLDDIRAQARNQDKPPASPEMEAQIAKANQMWRDVAEGARSWEPGSSPIVQGGRPESNRRKY